MTVGVRLVNEGALMSLFFTRVTEADAGLLLKWRSSPEITKHMFSDLSNNTIEEQKKWIRSLANRQDYRAYIIKDDLQPIGFLAFTDIDFTHKRCSTGLYIYEKVAGLKYAVTLNYYISHYIFRRLGCNKIVLYILTSNEKAMKMQEKNGARFVGCLRQHIFKNNEFHDVNIYEALKEEWEYQRPVFSLEHIQNAFDDWRDE